MEIFITHLLKKKLYEKKTFANVHVQNSAVLLGFVVKKKKQQL